MLRKLKNLQKPNLQEIFRTDTLSVESAIAHLVSALTPVNINWNYIDGHSRIMSAYKGLHSIDVLTHYPASKSGKDGAKYNAELVTVAAPVAFSRTTSVVKVERQTFAYGRNREAAFRIPFVFIENGVIKAYALQAKKHDSMSLDQVAGYCSLIKRYFLDQQYYGMPTDIEFVDASCKPGEKTRSVKKYNLADLELWSDERLLKHLDVVIEALDFIENQALVPKSRRPLKEQSMPLFGD